MHVHVHVLMLRMTITCIRIDETTNCRTCFFFSIRVQNINCLCIIHRERLAVTVQDTMTPRCTIFFRSQTGMAEIMSSLNDKCVTFRSIVHLTDIIIGGFVVFAVWMSSLIDQWFGGKILSMFPRFDPGSGLCGLFNNSHEQCKIYVLHSILWMNLFQRNMVNYYTVFRGCNCQCECFFFAAIRPNMMQIPSMGSLQLGLENRQTIQYISWIAYERIHLGTRPVRYRALAIFRMEYVWNTIRLVWELGVIRYYNICKQTILYSCSISFNQPQIIWNWSKMNWRLKVTFIRYYRYCVHEIGEYNLHLNLEHLRNITKTKTQNQYWLFKCFAAR